MEASILLCILLAGGLLVKLLNCLWLRPKNLENLLRKQGLRGNSYRLVVGDVRELISAVKEEQLKPIQLSDDLPSHILPYYHRMISTYGQNCFIWLGPSPKLMIADPLLIKEILAKPDVFRKPRPDPIGETLAGGLLFLEGQKWAHHRKIIGSAFHMDKLKKMVPAISLSCSKMLEKWEGLFCDSEKLAVEVDVWPFLEDLSGDVISRVAFSSSYEQGRRIFELQQEQVKLVLEILHFIFIPGWRFVPTRANRRMKGISREIQSLVRDIIQQREKEKDSSIDDDLLGTLMQSNAGISREDVINECRLFYLAGSETTSLLLVWTMVMLSKHQEWQERARQEVLQVFGDSEPTLHGLNRLKTVTLILQEVLRLYPPVPLITRAPTKTVKLGNITLPVGVDLMVLIGLVHHDPKIWGDDVNEFKPERFTDGIARSQSASIPFSSGPRVCIGQQLAMMQAKVGVAMMLQRFSFELSASYLHAPFPILTLQPQHGAALLLHKL